MRDNMIPHHSMHYNRDNHRAQIHKVTAGADDVDFIYQFVKDSRITTEYNTNTASAIDTCQNIIGEPKFQNDEDFPKEPFVMVCFIILFMS